MTATPDGGRAATHEAAATVRDLVLIKHPASPPGYGWMVVDAGSAAGYGRLGWEVIELAPIVAAAGRTHKLEELLKEGATLYTGSRRGFALADWQRRALAVFVGEVDAWKRKVGAA